MTIEWISLLCVIFLALGALLGYQFSTTQSAQELTGVKTRVDEMYPLKKVTKKKEETRTPMVNVESNEVKLAVEEERARIKNMLHDDTVQRLVAIKIRLESLTLAPTFSVEKAGVLLDDLERTVVSLRFIIANMIDEEYHQNTLSELLHNFEKRFERFLLMRVIVNEKGEENTFELTPKEKNEIVLIVQEALQNTIKHANSQQFHIYITWYTDKVVIETEDDLWGPDPNRTIGMGSTSMGLRANNIGATFSMRFYVGRGMQVRVELPRAKHSVL
ncbi:MAG: sensor histidine kinase [Cytophagales bacterium]